MTMVVTKIKYTVFPNKILTISHLLHTQVQVVVKARSRADIGVAFGALEDLSIITSSSAQHHSSRHRPQSAPTTKMEALRACRQVTSTAASPKLSDSHQQKDEPRSLTKPGQHAGRTRKLRPRSCFASPTHIK